MSLQNGRTPLHEAARNNLKDIAELLISQGADVNAKDKVCFALLLDMASGIYCSHPTWWNDVILCSSNISYSVIATLIRIA